MNFIIDDPGKDPTYKALVGDVKATSRVLRSQGPAEEKYLPIVMRTHRRDRSNDSEPTSVAESSTSRDSDDPVPSKSQSAEIPAPENSPEKLIDISGSIGSADESMSLMNETAIHRETSEEEFHDTLAGDQNPSGGENDV